MNYGYESRYSIRGESYGPGKLCPGCKSTVPDDEVHQYFHAIDRYYFLCEKNCKRFYSSVEKRKYHVDVDTHVQTDHIISKIIHN